MSCWVTVIESPNDDPNKDVGRCHMYTCVCGYQSQTMSFEMVCMVAAYHEAYDEFYKEMENER